MATAKTLSGADIKVYVNGRLYSPVSGLKFSASYGRSPLMGIDKSTPFELTSGVCEVKGTLDIFRRRTDGGIQGAGIAATERLILQERYFSLTVVERLSDSVVLQINEASVSDESWNIGRGIIQGSVSFTGIGWSNEADF